MATPLPAHRRQTISRRSGVKSSGEVLAEGADRSRQTTDSAKLDAYRFAEFDADGDKKLDFEEFLAFLPKRIRDVYTPRDIRAWFDAADTNGDGTLSTNEFFRFSLSSSALRWGANPIKSIFEKFDSDQSGELDSHEFCALASEMGFRSGIHARLEPCATRAASPSHLHQASSWLLPPTTRWLRIQQCATGAGARPPNAHSVQSQPGVCESAWPVAHELFVDLDRDDSGAIRYEELLGYIEQHVPEDEEQKQLFTSLAWTWECETQDEGRVKERAASALEGITIRARDMQGVKAELRDKLAQTGLQVLSVHTRYEHFFTHSRPPMSPCSHRPSPHLDAATGTWQS